LKSIPAILALALAPFYLGAQPTSPGSPKPPPAAQVRIWFAVPPDSPPTPYGEASPLKTPFELSLKTPGAGPEMLRTCARPYAMLNYLDIAPGNTQLELRRITADAVTAVGKETVNLKKGAWYTLLIRPQPGREWATLLEDYVPPAKPEEEVVGEVPVRVSSLLSGVTATLRVEGLGKSSQWQDNSKQGEIVFSLPLGTHQVVAEGTFKGEKFSQSVFLRLRGDTRPVLLFSKDRYDRFGLAVQSLPEDR